MFDTRPRPKPNEVLSQKHVEGGDPIELVHGIVKHETRYRRLYLNRKR